MRHRFDWRTWVAIRWCVDVFRSGQDNQGKASADWPASRLPDRRRGRSAPRADRRVRTSAGWETGAGRAAVWHCRLPDRPASGDGGHRSSPVAACPSKSGQGAIEPRPAHTTGRKRPARGAQPAHRIAGREPGIHGARGPHTIGSKTFVAAQPATRTTHTGPVGARRGVPGWVCARWLAGYLSSSPSVPMVVAGLTTRVDHTIPTFACVLAPVQSPPGSRAANRTPGRCMAGWCTRGS